MRNFRVVYKVVKLCLQDIYIVFSTLNKTKRMWLPCVYSASTVFEMLEISESYTIFAHNGSQNVSTHAIFLKVFLQMSL